MAIVGAGVVPARADLVCPTAPLRLVRTIAAPDADDYGFGYSLATSGTDVVVTAPYRTDGTITTGIAYLIDADSSAVVTTFENPSTQDADLFGVSAAARDGLVYVGAPNLDDGADTHAGAAYQYYFGATPTHAYLASPTIADGQFGAGLAVLGDDVVVSSPEAAEAYRLDPATGTVAATYATATSLPKAFGFSIAATGDLVVIGDYEQGDVVEVFDGASGTLERTVSDPSPGLGTFGAAIARAGGDVLVTAWSSTPGLGVAHRIDPSTGTVEESFANPDLTDGGFGNAVTALGDRVAVSGSGVADAGVVQVFDANGTHVQTIESPEPAGLFFGWSLTAVGDSLVVGMPVGPGQTAGAVYVFAPCGNGVIDTGETCDDGNVDDGDGCSSSCQGAPLTYAANVTAWAASEGRPSILACPRVSACHPLDVRLEAVAEHGCGQRIVECGYNWGDGSPPELVDVDDEGVCEARTHTYPYPGVFKAVLQARTAAGPVSQVTVDIDVNPTTVAADPVALTQAIDSCLTATVVLPEAAPPCPQECPGPTRAACMETCPAKCCPGCPEPEETVPSGCPVHPDDPEDCPLECSEPDEPAPFVAGEKPTIVEFSPYVFNTDHPLGYMVRSGYNYVHVTHRGQGTSCDAPDPYGEDDQTDLGKIGTWLTTQTWATDDFCLVGYSGPAFMGGIAMARGVPENLKCAVLGGGSFDWYDGGVTKMGAHWPGFPYWIAATYWNTVDVDPVGRIPAVITFGIAAHTRVKDGTWTERDVRDAIVDPVSGANVPMLMHTSHQDAMSSTSSPYLTQASGLRHAHSAVFVYSGPHNGLDMTLARPPTAVGNTTNLLTGELRTFFDHFLLGEAAAPDTDQYDVRYTFEMGGLQAALVHGLASWATSSTWPPDGSVVASLYLDPTDADIIDSRGDHSLAAVAPSTGSVTFGYEPPSLWNPAVGIAGTNMAFPDMRALEHDAFTFTSGPVDEAIPVSGNPTLYLRASSTLYDWDWMVFLDDVWPDGSSHQIAGGFLRASARNGLDDEAAAPSGPQDYVIPLNATANLVMPGHRLRVSIFQLNATDDEPSVQTTTIDLTASRLDFSTADGVTLPSPLPCVGCDTAAADPRPFEWKRQFLTVGYEAQNGTRLFGYVRDGSMYDVEDTKRGRFFVEHDESVHRCRMLDYTGDLLASEPNGISVALDCDFDDGDVEFELTLFCDRETRTGGLVEMTSPAVGALAHAAGRVQCYDTPFSNFPGDDEQHDFPVISE